MVFPSPDAAGKDFQRSVTEEAQLMMTTESEQLSSFHASPGKVKVQQGPIPTETSMGSFYHSGSRQQTITNESNFFSAHHHQNPTTAGNELVSSGEKSPYAVTLHNVDKFELLTEVKSSTLAKSR